MKNDVFNLLNRLNINYNIMKHPPLFSCEDTNKYNLTFDALICKNLFIRNSNKSQYYLVVLPLEKRLDLKYLKEHLLETRLSFGDEKSLEEKLGTKHGAVSIFNAINKKSHDIIFLLDKDILNHKKVGFHPNINTETVIFDSENLYKILDFFNIKYIFIKI